MSTANICLFNNFKAYVLVISAKIGKKYLNSSCFFISYSKIIFYINYNIGTNNNYFKSYKTKFTSYF